MSLGRLTSRLGAALQVPVEPQPRIDLPQLERGQDRKQSRGQATAPQGPGAVIVLPPHSRSTQAAFARGCCPSGCAGRRQTASIPTSVLAGWSTPCTPAFAESDRPTPRRVAAAWLRRPAPSRLVQQGPSASASRWRLQRYRSRMRCSHAKAQGFNSGQPLPTRTKSRRTCAQQNARIRRAVLHLEHGLISTVAIHHQHAAGLRRVMILRHADGYASHPGGTPRYPRC